jgi:Domain of unknown function (DUF4337)
MHEVMEAHEAGEHHEEIPFMMAIAVTLSTLAVLVSIATLLGHRASTEEVILTTRVSDQWNLFQAKNSRQHEMEVAARQLSTLMPADKEKAAEFAEEYKKEADRYSKEKEEASEQSKELDAERDLASRKGNRYDAGEVILEIALIVCSLTLLTKKRIFWFTGIGVGLVGVVTTASGLLLR